MAASAGKPMTEAPAHSLKKRERLPVPTEITGKVTSASGEALAGVTVVLKGTTLATSTNGNGIFSLRLPEASGTLVFTYIGYTTREVPVTNATVYNIKLSEDAQALQEIEVVNIGYGEARRADLTGSIGTVNMADLYKAPVKSFDEALAGRVAGVQVTSSEGQPGSPINIVIRGANSITQNNAPLYVIDGFPIEDPSINALSPNEIESIDILKDASATAIYGARGANGVILITTKKGKAGTPSITYSGYYGIQESNKRMPVLSPYEFVKLQQELDPIKTAELYLAGKGKTLEDYRNVQGYDWEDAIMQTAPIQSHQVSLSGGSEKTRYTLSASYFDQEGVIINSGFDRFQSRFSLTQDVSEKLRVNVNASYSQYKSYGTPPSAGQGSGQNNLLYSVWGYRPVSSEGINLIELTDDPEIETNNEFRFNPILTVQNELRDNNFETLIGNAFADYSILKNLKLRVAGGVTRSSRKFEFFNGSKSRSAQANDKVNGGFTNIASTSWQSINTLTFDKKIASHHNLNVVGVFSAEGSEGSTYGATAKLLPNETLGLSGLDEGTVGTVSAASSDWTLLSFLSRVNYNYKSKYLLTVSLRADGSSKFATGNKWSYFPSGSFAWQLGKEEFMKELAFINSAKVRTSWGITGNNRVGDYSYMPRITVPQDGGYFFGNQPSKGSYPTDLGNSDLKWESTRQVDLGIDLALFNHRVTFTADVYRKTTDDLLLNANLPLSTGYSRGFKNIGKVQNQGLEMALGLSPIQGKEFTWTTDINISFNRNKVLSLAENETSLLTAIGWDYGWTAIPAYIAKIGKPIAQMYGLIWDGVYTYEDFDVSASGAYSLKDLVPDNGTPRNSIRPGDIKYRDINQDGVINEYDKTIIGNPNPIHFGGISNNFAYKGFDLSVFFQWSYGNDVINANRIFLESGYRYNVNQYATFADRWSEENPTSNIPRAKGQLYSTYSSRIVEDGSFIRLKTVQLGYRVPQHLLSRAKIKSLRLYVAAQNLHTWSNYSGYDPEVSVRPGALTEGFDYSAYPRARTTTVGLDVTF